jgi:hypothetical protein
MYSNEIIVMMIILIVASINYYVHKNILFFGFMMVLIVLLMYHIYKNNLYKKKLNPNLWKTHLDDIIETFDDNTEYISSNNYNIFKYITNAKYIKRYENLGKSIIGLKSMIKSNKEVYTILTTILEEFLKVYDNMMKRGGINQSHINILIDLHSDLKQTYGSIPKKLQPYVDKIDENIRKKIKKVSSLLEKKKKTSG